MFRTLSIVVSVGLADSLNASTIGPALFLAGGKCPRWSVLEFTLGVVAVFFLGGALLVLGPGEALLALVPHPSRTARHIVETVAGLVMLVVALALWTRRHSLVAGKRSSGAGTPMRQRRSPALAGAGIAAVELPTAFPYFVAIAKIISSRIGLGRELLLVAVYDFCFVLPLLGIIFMLTVAGDGATEKLARMRAQFEAHWPTVAAVAAFVVGVYVLALGVTGLT